MAKGCRWAFLAVCCELNVPAALERSRSGNGGHVWIFFDQAIPATTARKLGCAILTRAMESRHQLGLDSYDRFFPNQDTMLLEKYFDAFVYVANWGTHEFYISRRNRLTTGCSRP